MKVQYVGRQKPHRERLYGTRVKFSGPGDVQEIADESIARKMINNHPDQYADCEHDDIVDANAQLEASGQSLEQSLVDAQDDETDATDDTGSTDDTDATDETATHIVLAGQETALDAVSKDVLIDVAKRGYEVDIPVRTSKSDMVDIVAKLITERGQPKGL